MTEKIQHSPGDVPVKSHSLYAYPISYCEGLGMSPCIIVMEILTMAVSSATLALYTSSLSIL